MPRDTDVNKANDVLVNVYNASLDVEDDLVRQQNFAIINKMDIRYRVRMAERIVSRYMDEADKIALRELAENRRKFHVFNGRVLPFDGDRETVATLQMGFLSLVGARPFGFLEGDGAVARSVKPKPGSENHVSTSGRRDFDAHIDHAWGRFAWEADDWRPIIPDYLTLGGFQNPDRVATLFADPIDVLSETAEITQYVLEQPEWTFLAPPSVQPPMVATRLAIVTRGPDRLPVIRLNPRIISDTERAADALADLKLTLQKRKLWTEVVLDECDIVVARGTALHKRGEIKGHRELVAIYGRDNTTRSRVLSEANQHLEPIRN